MWYQWIACVAGASFLFTTIVANWSDIVRNKISFLRGTLVSIVPLVLGMFLFTEIVARYTLAFLLVIDVIKLWAVPTLRQYPVVTRVFMSMVFLVIVGGLLVR